MKKLSLLLLLFTIAFSTKGQTYCTPTYTGGYYSCSYYGMHIISMKLAGSYSSSIYDTSSCDGSGYLDRTSRSCALNMGSSYAMTINTSGTYSMSGQIWIDFDNDGSFVASESVGGFTAGTGTQIFTISLPAGTSSGTNRMRVCVNDAYYGGGTYPSINPCGGYYYGETRDYSINYTPSPVGILVPATTTFPPTTAGTTSSADSLVFNGAYLTPTTGNLTVTAGTNFSICSTAGGTYVSSYTLYYTGGSTSSNIIYVKFNAPSTVGYYSDSVCVTGGGLSSAVCAGVTGSSGSTLNVAQISEVNDFIVYPNPATTELIINTLTKVETITITNLLGQVMPASQFVQKGTTYYIDISSLQAGVYFVKINSTKARHFLKL